MTVLIAYSDTQYTFTVKNFFISNAISWIKLEERGKKTMTLLFFFIFLTSLFTSHSKGLYTGVPCHRAYSCIFEENDDGFQNSLLIGEEFNVETERTCQDLCWETGDCVSYSWWKENEPENSTTRGFPFLCQMFSVCHRNYHNPNFTPVYSGNISGLKLLERFFLIKSGPAGCDDPVIVFGGDGEDRIDPVVIEMIWPGYEDGFDNSGYVTIGSLDPIPDIPEQSYGSFWYHSAVFVEDSRLILSCGGGFPATNKCFGLDLVLGTWRSMAPMTSARNDHSLVKEGFNKSIDRQCIIYNFFRSAIL